MEGRIVVDRATKFHDSIHIDGWFHSPHGQLTGIRLMEVPEAHQISATGLPNDGVSTLSPNLGFSCQALLGPGWDFAEARLELTMATGAKFEVGLSELVAARRGIYQGPRVTERALSLIAPGSKVLDLGGRARSGWLLKEQLNGVNVTCLDIVEGPGVDVVADAHEMSRFLPHSYFDAAVSVSVFEHLLMPWKVVLELNKVVRVGGLILIQTHQTLGIHDHPWDYWRFSDSAWAGLFNEATGFVVEEVIMDLPMYILPHLYSDAMAECERSAGFEMSVVVARKTSNSRVEWDVPLGNLVATQYPE